METSPLPQQSIFPKYLAAIVVLLIMLLFPSQAPESLKKKIFPQLWELLRLFFIGVSICYGILCTRRSGGGGGDDDDNDGAGDLDSEPYSLLDASISYFSGISNTSPIFEFPEIIPVLNADNKPLGLPIRSLKSGLEGCSDWEMVVSSHNNNKLQSGVTDLAAKNPGKAVRVSRLREGGGKVAAAPALEYGGGDDEIVGEDRATFSRGSSNAWSRGGRTPLSSPSRDGPLRQRHGGRILGTEGEAMDVAEASVISDALESRSSSEMNSQAEDEFNEEIMTTMSNDMNKNPSHPLRSWSFWRPTPSETNPPAPPSPVSSPTASSSPNLVIVKVDDHPEEEAKVTVSSTPTKCSPEDSSSSSSSSSPLIDKKIQSLYSQGRTSGPRGVPRGKSVRTIRPRMLDESKSNASSSSSSTSLSDPLETLSSSLLMMTTRNDVDGSKSNANASSSSRSLIDPLETLSSSMLMTTPRKGVEEPRPVPPPAFAYGGKEDDDISESRDDSASVWNESETSSDGGKSGRSYFSDDMELGSEVDRKADEFIAKFKEQIRLQKGLN